MSSFNEGSLKEDNGKVLFYTGLLNCSLLLCSFNFVKNSSPELKSSRGILSAFQKGFAWVNLREVEFVR